MAAYALPATASAAGTTTVWVPTSVCGAPQPGHMACLAQKLVKHVVPSSSSVRAAAAKARPALTDGPAGGYTGLELAKAYGLNVNGAASQTVAIVDAFDDPTVLSDLNHFDAANGIAAETSSSFREVFDTPGHATPTADPGWALEITLDVQAVRGLCHKCKILLVEANSDSDADIGHAAAYAAQHARIVSNSYGTPDTDPDATAGVMADYNKPGVAMIAASGDDGWYGWDFANCNNTDCGGAGQSPDNAPSVPASLNTVVGVGGTALHLTPSGTRAAEQVWNENGQGDIFGFNLGEPMGASGSGCSTKYGPQRWQSHVSNYGSLGCGTKRNGVDIAADADPYTGFDIYQNFGNTNCPSFCWETIGGTSLASPLIAAMWALAGGPGSVTYPALSLYGHFRATAGSTYDVTVGGTGLCDWASPVACNAGINPNQPGFELDCAWNLSGSSDAVLPHRYQCYAQPGYDGVSGVGTPRGTTVFKPMTPHAVIRSPGTVTHNVTHTFSAVGTSDPFPGGGIRTYSWNWGDGHTTNTSSVTASHTYTSQSTRTITLTVTDIYGMKASKKITISVK